MPGVPNTALLDVTPTPRAVVPSVLITAPSGASRPSTLSALRLETLVEELTASGAPESTSSLKAGPAPLLSSTLTALAKLDWPTLKTSPLAPRAAVATPNTKASMTARPTTNTVALPTHITFLAAFLSISLASFSEGGTRQPRRVDQRHHSSKPGALAVSRK